MNSRYLLFTAVFLLFAFMVAIQSFSQLPLPQELEEKRKEFIEKQIIFEHKIFLNKVSSAFGDLAKINARTLAIIKSMSPEEEKTYDNITHNFIKAAKVALSHTVDEDLPLNNLENFSNVFFPEHKNIPLELKNIFDGYKKCSKINDYIPQDSERQMLADGTYHYYKMCLGSFENAYGRSLPDMLNDAAKVYGKLSEASRNLNIKEIKDLLPQAFNDIQKAQILIQDRIIDKIELSNSNWAKYIMLAGLEVVQNQLTLNKDLTTAITAKMETIATPSEPVLPNFQVASIMFEIPKRVKVGKVIKVIAEVKNAGDLPLERSRVMIMFPDGTISARPLPKLAPGKICLVTWSYRLQERGKHTFRVKVNYDNAAWEANTQYNETQRDLILP